MSKSHFADSYIESQLHSFLESLRFERVKEAFSSPNAVALLIAISLHLMLASFFLLDNSRKTAPILSFTVTMMDVSSASNTVASAASSASNSEFKSENKADEVKTDMGQVVQNKSVSTNSVNKSNAAESSNSLAQTAVVSNNSQAVYDASYLSNPAPKYPAISKIRYEQGTVLLSVFVNENGQADKVAIKQSSGFERLDESALITVKKWKFIAAHQADKVTASWIEIPVKFILENN